jgi:hypothetical protein
VQAFPVENAIGSGLCRLQEGEKLKGADVEGREQPAQGLQTDHLAAGLVVEEPRERNAGSSRQLVRAQTPQLPRLNQPPSEVREHDKTL